MLFSPRRVRHAFLMQSVQATRWKGKEGKAYGQLLIELEQGGREGGQCDRKGSSLVSIMHVTAGERDPVKQVKETKRATTSASDC